MTLPERADRTEPLPLRRILVGVPAYNEDRFLGSVLLKLRAQGYPVVVVDDGSTDQTSAVAERAGAEVIRHPANAGKAAAVATIFESVRGRRFDALVLIDGDSQHDPAEVDVVAAPVLEGRADMVVGSRFAGARSRIPAWRRAGQHALTLVTNLGSGEAIKDSQSGFRAFSPRAVEQMRFQRDGFSVESEMQFLARQHQLRVCEVPIHVRYDVPAKRSAIRQGLDVIDSILRLVAQHRPLLFFGVPGLLLFLAGAALGWHVVRIYEQTFVLAVGYALVTVLLSLVGVFAMLVAVMLHTIRALFVEFSRQRD